MRMRATALSKTALLMGLIALILFVLLAPQYLGIIESVRLIVWPAADWDTTHSWKDEPDFRYDCPRDEFEHHLGERGFTRNSIAYLTYSDGQAGASWAYREHPLAAHQTHVILYDVDGTTHVYTLREWNVYRHPLKHYHNPGAPSLTPTATAVFTDVESQSPLWIRQKLSSSSDCPRK